MGNCLVIQQDGSRKDDKEVVKIMTVLDGSKAFTGPSKAPMAAAATVTADEDPAGCAVRVKLVVSKQELQRMLDREGGVSLDDMVASLVTRKEATSRCYWDKSGRPEAKCCGGGGGWRPALESIPEGSCDL